jgi:hypothetical protein
MSREDVELVHAALLSRGWSQVAAALGVSYRSPRHREKCPIHNGDSENFTLDEHDGRLAYFCASTCGSGDVISLVQKLRGCSFPEALRHAADLGGVELGGDDETGDARAERERARDAYLKSHRDRLAAEPKPERHYAPEAEVEALWRGAGRVDEDAEAAAYLESRAIPAAVAASRDLLRVIRPGQVMPRWASRRGQDEQARTWLETGHRILIRTWDHLGQWRGVRAWRVNGDETTPKRLPPSGCISAGLVWANDAAVTLLRDPYPTLIVISEGEPDACVHWVRGAYATIGITSGSWTQALSDRIPYGSEVVIRTDNDEAGEKYSRQIQETLRGRLKAWRVAA